MSEANNTAETERGLIAALLLAPSKIDDILEIVKPGDFSDGDLGRLFGILAEMSDADEPLDDQTILMARLRADGLLEQLGGVEGIGHLFELEPSAAHAEYYAGIIRDGAKRRRLAVAGSRIRALADDTDRPPDDLLGDAQAALDGVSGDREGKHLIDSAASIQAALAILDNPERRRFVPTGFCSFDRAYGGLAAGELIVLAGRPGQGKSACALTICEHVAVADPVVLVSLEMQHVEIARRRLSMRSGVPFRAIRTGELHPSERAAIDTAATELSQFGLQIDGRPGATTADIRRTARAAKRRGGLSLLVVDYAGLITANDPKQPRYQQVGQITADLKRLAQELEIPVLLLAQLNRDAEKTERPTLGHLRESGALEQDADAVAFIVRDDENEKGTLIVAKHRNGPTADYDLDWHGPTMRFTEHISMVQVASVDDWQAGTTYAEVCDRSAAEYRYYDDEDGSEIL